MLNRNLVHTKKLSSTGGRSGSGSGGSSSGGFSCMNVLWLIAFFAIAALSLTFVAYHHYHETGIDEKLPDRIKNPGTSPAIVTPTANSGEVAVKDNLRKQTSVPVVIKPNKPDPYKTNSETVYAYNQSSIPAFTDIHFVHIPKCGGTTMTTVLRQIQCILDPVRNEDCCTNPGFCDWHAHRRCATIKGCINHFPQRKFIFQSMPSIVVFREPTARLLSAWFYRGHSPNLDFFQVRPEFKEISQGKRPKVKFPEYIEMVEYQNIQTRMLGADSFPYRNISITEDLFDKAVDALNHFHFVGLQEEFEISAKMLIREMGVSPEKGKEIALVNEREQGSNKNIKTQKNEILANKDLMGRVREVNDYDIRLYKLAVEKFCNTLKKHRDLWEEVKAHDGKVKCS